MKLQDVQASFGRCCLNPDFLDFFYKTFVASSPEAATKLINTDFNKQKRLMQTGLNMLFSYAMGTGVVVDYMTRLAEEHSRHKRNIPPHLYDIWLDSLMVAVKKFDSKYTPELDKEWRAALQPGIQLMKSKY